MTHDPGAILLAPLPTWSQTKGRLLLRLYYLIESSIRLDATRCDSPSVTFDRHNPTVQVLVFSFSFSFSSTRSFPLLGIINTSITILAHLIAKAISTRANFLQLYRIAGYYMWGHIEGTTINIIHNKHKAVSYSSEKKQQPA